MLKTSRNIESTARFGEGGIIISGDSKVGCNGSEYDKSKIDSGEVDGNKVGDNEVEKKVQKMSKSKNLSKYKKIVGSNFFIPEVRLAFTKLR